MKNVPRTESQRGVALLQFALVITLVGVLLTVGYQFFTPEEHLSASLDALRSAEAAHTAAAVNITKTNGFLPCPDLNSDGVSDSAACTGTAPIWGTLPFVTMGLRTDNIRDRFGSMLTYAVGTGAPNADICSGGGLAAGKLTDQGPGASTASYVLVSHGPNRSYALAAAQASQPGSTSESENCPKNAAGAACDATFNAGTFRSGPTDTTQPTAGNYFDDIVSIPDLSPYACLCSMAKILNVAGEAPEWNQEDAEATILVPTGDATVKVSIGITNPGQTACSPRLRTWFSDPDGAASAVESTVETSVPAEDWRDAEGAEEVTITFTIPYPEDEKDRKDRTIVVRGQTAEESARGATEDMVTLRIKYDSSAPTGNNPGSGCYMANGDANGRPPASQCPPPPGHFASGNWVNNNDRPANDPNNAQAIFTNLHAYWDFHGQLNARGGGNTTAITTKKGRTNSLVQRDYTMDYNLSLGAPCYSATPDELGPFYNSAMMSFSNGTNVPINSDNGKFYFMGSKMGGCGSHEAPLIMRFSGVPNGERLKRYYMAIKFDPHFAGTISQPQAVGIVYRYKGEDVGTVYRCYAENWYTTPSAYGAEELFPDFADPWGRLYNWCNGLYADQNSNTPTSAAQYIEIYLYGRATGSTAEGAYFDEVEIFPVGNTRFWFGGVGLGLN